MGSAPKVAKAQASEAATCHASACRSATPRNHFIKAHPLPKGLLRDTMVVDHIIPLACGGPDDPSNMQWQTRGAGKKKDRWELKCALAKDSAVIHARITRDSVLKAKKTR